MDTRTSEVAPPLVVPQIVCTYISLVILEDTSSCKRRTPNAQEWQQPEQAAFWQTRRTRWVAHTASSTMQYYAVEPILSWVKALDRPRMETRCRFLFLKCGVSCSALRNTDQREGAGACMKPTTLSCRLLIGHEPGRRRHPHNLHKWTASRTRWQPRPTARATRPFAVLSHTIQTCLFAPQAVRLL